MKNNIFALILTVLAVLILAFSSKTIQTKKSSAEVNQIQGIYIFVDAQPVLPYEYLGTTQLTSKDLRKDKGSRSGQYQNVRDILLNKLKKDFPQVEGVIFHFYDGGIDKADAIKFK